MFRSAATAATRAPTTPEPVKLTARTASCRRSGSPVTRPRTPLPMHAAAGRRAARAAPAGCSRARAGPLGWLQHHGVAERERGRRLPERDGQREVPGRDERDDAERLPERELQGVRELRGDDLAHLAHGLSRVVAEDRDTARDLAARL